MDFSLTDEQVALREMARKFATKEISPIAAEYDEREEFPFQVAEKAFEAGLMNALVPEAYGGGGLSLLDTLVIQEELAYGCAGIASMLFINNIALTPLVLAGTEAQKEKFLLPICEAPKFAAICISEPGSGSDVASISTTAKKVGDRYILNGSKIFITAGGVADFYTVLAYTDKSKRHHGMSCFAVPRSTPGITVSKKFDKMGQRAANTVEMTFEEVEIPAENLIGQEGEGFKLIMQTFNESRPGVAISAIGIARRAFDEALHYSQTRQQFGRPIFEFQSPQFLLTDMATKIAAGRWLAYHAAWLFDQGKNNAREAAMAKAFCADAVMEITTNAVQIFGGYGYMREYPVEKLMRDAKVVQIYEGTTQIQNVLIAKSLQK